MKKIITLFIYILSATICFSAAYGAEDITAKSVRVDNSVIAAERADKISLAQDDTIALKSVYAKGNNAIGAMLKARTMAEGTQLFIDDKLCDYTVETDSAGYAYLSFNTEILSNGTIKITKDNDVLVNESFTPVEAVEGTENWIASDDGHILYTYTGSDADITVPNIYNDKIIRCVGGKSLQADDGATFYNILNNSESAALSSVSFSEGINEVGDYACYLMNSVKDIKLPNTLEYIGGLSFAGTSISGTLTIPPNVKEIYAYAFMQSPITEVKLNDGLERLCSAVFAGCSSLQYAPVFPDSLYYLGERVFISCSSMTGDVIIPGSIGSVGYAVFYNCKNLNGTVTLEEGITEVGELAFGCDYSNANKITSFVFPSTFKKIGPYAFQYCTGVTQLTLPDSLEIICDGAFDHMTGLTQEELVIPASVTTIGGDYNVDENTGYGGHIFYDMGKDSSFKAITVAEGNEKFKSIDGVLYSMDGTRLLAYPRGKTDETLEVPEGVTQMDEMAFSRAKKLKTLVLPNSYIVKSELPDNILNKTDANTLSAALYLYTGIESITVKDDNENYICKDGLLYSKNGETLWYIPTRHSGEISIAEGTKTIEKGAVFTANKANTGWTSIVIPSSVTYIDSHSMDYFNTYFSDIITNNSEGYITDSNNKLCLLGDTDGNNILNNKDAINILKYLIGKAPEGFNADGADYNRDNEINLTDSIRILAAAS